MLSCSLSSQSARSHRCRRPSPRHDALGSRRRRSAETLPCRWQPFLFPSTPLPPNAAFFSNSYKNDHDTPTLWPNLNASIAARAPKAARLPFPLYSQPTSPKLLLYSPALEKKEGESSEREDTKLTWRRRGLVGTLATSSDSGRAHGLRGRIRDEMCGKHACVGCERRRLNN